MVWLRSIRQALFFPTAVIVLAGLPDSFLPNFTLYILFTLALILLAIWTLAQLVSGALAAWRRAWHLAAVSFLSVALVVVAFRPVISAINWLSRYVHLTEFSVRNTISVVSPDKREGTIEVFNWGAQGISAGASEERFLLRDPDRKSQSVVGTKPWPDYPGAAIETRHLIGAYYLRVLHYP